MKQSLGLVGALVTAGLMAACGSAAPPVATPPTPTSAPIASATTSPIASATPIAPPAQTAAPVNAGPTRNTPLQRSKLVDTIKAAGIDLNKPPLFDTIPTATKVKLMQSFVDSLGFKGCDGCHQTDASGALDYKLKSRNMKIAKKMWDEFVVGHRDENNAALFCDSCHAGSNKILNRGDKKAIADFMTKNYKDRLTLANKDESGCSSCHGDSFQLKIISKLWGIAAN